MHHASQHPWHRKPRTCCEQGGPQALLNPFFGGGEKNHSKTNYLNLSIFKVDCLTVDFSQEFEIRVVITEYPSRNGRSHKFKDKNGFPYRFTGLCFNPMAFLESSQVSTDPTTTQYLDHSDHLSFHIIIYDPIIFHYTKYIYIYPMLHLLQVPMSIHFQNLEPPERSHPCPGRN